MQALLDLMRELRWADALALLTLLAGWTAYAVFAARRARSTPTLLALTNRERRRWMYQATFRENRVMEGVVVQNLSTAPSFFASTTILIIGGLLAVLFTSEKATEIVREIPFAARTSLLLFDTKIVLMTGIFIYAFFRFTWSLRQYSFGIILVAAAPEHTQFETEAQREAFALRAGGVMGLAAESFNDGVRAYYMAFAAAAWFISPWACIAATAGVVLVLYGREFRSEVLRLLSQE